jgi:hypothetical protein
MTSVGSSCGTSNVYLTPPAWYWAKWKAQPKVRGYTTVKRLIQVKSAAKGSKTQSRL